MMFTRRAMLGGGASLAVAALAPGALALAPVQRRYDPDSHFTLGLLNDRGVEPPNADYNRKVLCLCETDYGFDLLSQDRVFQPRSTWERIEAVATFMRDLARPIHIEPVARITVLAGNTLTVDFKEHAAVRFTRNSPPNFWSAK